jgi:hypothetical protein
MIFCSLGLAQAPSDKSLKVDVGRPGLTVQKQQADLEAAGIGRYQLIGGEFSVAGGTETKKAVFKIDTKTGATWIFFADPKDAAASGTWKPIGR